MRTIVIPLAALGLLGAAAPAAPREDALASALAGRVAGTPVDCVDHARLGGPQIIDEKTLIYRESGRRIWRNDLIGSCPGLRPMDTLIVDVFGSQLCRNDHFRALTPGTTIPSAICRLGKFTPYDKPAKAK
jgi:hypothetical protein